LRRKEKKEKEKKKENKSLMAVRGDGTKFRDWVI